VPGGITGPPCSWGTHVRGPGTPGWGSLESERVKYGHESHGTQTREWLRKPAAIINDRPILSPDRMLQKDCDRKGWVDKKKSAGRETQGACRQDELIGGKPPVVKKLTLTLTDSSQIKFLWQSSIYMSLILNYAETCLNTQIAERRFSIMLPCYTICAAKKQKLSKEDYIQLHKLKNHLCVYTNVGPFHHQIILLWLPERRRSVYFNCGTWELKRMISTPWTSR
jgi:hypothetical protein